MSGYSIPGRLSEACCACLRRSWLLGELSGPLDFCARDRARLSALLALTDAELLHAVGGRRRAELGERYQAFTPATLHRGRGVKTLCCHDRGYPRALRAKATPPMLNVLGGTARLRELCSVPIVAVVGSRSPSDYGREMARSLGRGLSASGVSVLIGWDPGISLAANTGALEATGAAVTVLGRGLEVASPASLRPELRQLTRTGCAVSELPCACGGRRWGRLASERTIAALAALTVVVEAEETAGDLSIASQAQALGRAVAAIPGRVTSPLSRGTNTLLRNGASLVRGAEDVLELLYTTEELSASSRPLRRTAPGSLRLAPRLHALLELIGAGRDTPDSLSDGTVTDGEVLLALSELELMGLLRRGDSGRYTPTEPLSGSVQASSQPSTSSLHPQD